MKFILIHSNSIRNQRKSIGNSPKSIRNPLEIKGKHSEIKAYQVEINKNSNEIKDGNLMWNGEGIDDDHPVRNLENEDEKVNKIVKYLLGQK